MRRLRRLPVLPTQHDDVIRLSAPASSQQYNRRWLLLSSSRDKSTVAISVHSGRRQATMKLVSVQDPSCLVGPTLLMCQISPHVLHQPVLSMSSVLCRLCCSPCCWPEWPCVLPRRCRHSRLRSRSFLQPRTWTKMAAIWKVLSPTTDGATTGPATTGQSLAP